MGGDAAIAAEALTIRDRLKRIVLNFTVINSRSSATSFKAKARTEWNESNILRASVKNFLVVNLEMT